jgi:F-type H+-transporting ATPase subunit epsilon
MSLKVSVMTPDKVFLETTVEEVILPTTTGQMGVLTNHTALVTALDIGFMSARTESGWEMLVLSGGFALIQNNQVTILVNEAELGNEIEAETAEEAVAAARTALDEAETNKERIEANLVFKRARARYQASLATKSGPF